MYACYQYTLDLLTVAASLRLALLTRVAAVDIIVIGMAVQAIVGEAPDSCEWLRNVATRGHQGQRKGECSSINLYSTTAIRHLSTYYLSYIFEPVRSHVPSAPPTLTYSGKTQ